MKKLLVVGCACVVCFALAAEPPVLADVDEMLECVEGNGLIQLERATVAFPPNTAFAGSVSGGDVK